MPSWHNTLSCSRPLLLISVSYHRFVKTGYLGQVYLGVIVTYFSMQSLAFPA